MAGPHSDSSGVGKSLATLPEDIRKTVNDAARRDALAALKALGAGPDSDFDRLTQLAALAFDAPIALIGILDVERQWFRSIHGPAQFIHGERLSVPFCTHVVADRAARSLVVPDATLDPRFSGLELVTGKYQIRFYAGAPIMVRGQRVGSLSVLSPAPRTEVTPQQIAQLIDLAAVAGSLFELKDEARVRARTAAALMREEWRHALTLEAGKVGSWIWDVRRGEIVANDILRRMYNLEPDEKVTARTIFSAVHPDDRRLLSEALRFAREGGNDYMVEFRVGASWMMARGRVYQRDADGRPLVIMGVNLDITETKLSTERTRVLLRELNHRVKNTLAMIQSLARQTLKRNPEPDEFIEAFSGRLRTLSDAHVLLSDRDWLGIGLLELIKLQVVDGHEDVFARLHIDGPDLDLPPDHALGLGLTLHELASNAVRYGALSTKQGIVTITWSVETVPERRLVLSWREQNGPPVVRPRQFGLGGKLIERSLGKVLGSTVSLRFPPSGVEADISLPLPS